MPWSCTQIRCKTIISSHARIVIGRVVVSVPVLLVVILLKCMLILNVSQFKSADVLFLASIDVYCSHAAIQLGIASYTGPSTYMEWMCSKSTLHP
jgi:ABC-type uncharacterized transport system permease subunit